MTRSGPSDAPPVVSCVIPVRNAAAWIRRCLESVLSEDTAEVVAVDDGSTDRSPEILESFRKANPGRMSVIRQQNTGPAAARNRGAAAAHGRWLWFVDADDFLVRGALPLVSDVLNRTNCDALAIGMGEFRFFPLSVSPLPETVWARPSDPATALFAFSCGAPRTIVRKQLWCEVMTERAEEENVWAEDNLSFARIMLKAKNVWQLRARVYARRLHSGSRSGLGTSMSPFAAKTAPKLLDRLADLRTSAPSALVEALEWRIARVAEYVSSTASVAAASGLSNATAPDDVAAAKDAAHRVLSSLPDFAGREILSRTISVCQEKASVQAATEAIIARFCALRAMRYMRDMVQEFCSCIAAAPARIRAERPVSAQLSDAPVVYSAEDMAERAQTELATARRIAAFFRVK